MATKLQSQLAAAEERAAQAERNAAAAQALAAQDRELATRQAEEIAGLQESVAALTADRDGLRDKFTAAQAETDGLKASAKTLEIRMVEQLGKLGIRAEDIPATGDHANAWNQRTPQNLTGRQRLAGALRIQGIQ